MPIVVQLDVMLAKRKVRSKALAEYVGITEVNVSLLKQGKVKGVRFETLEKICEFLDCQPGDLLEYKASTDESLRSDEGVRQGDRGGDSRSSSDDDAVWRARRS
jgi:putative transcriptional regulator